jgi:hypothetical protein
MALATSSGSHRRWSGIAARSFVSSSGVRKLRDIISERTKAGATAFVDIPFGPNSRARENVRPIIAALDRL